MRSMLTVIVTLSLSIPSHAGIQCTGTGVDHVIKEFYLGYSHLRGCFMNLERTDDGGRVSQTNIIYKGTANEKYDCTESIVGSDVLTEAKVNYDPAVLEPGESYPDFTLKVKGGVKNLELTFILIPGEYEWTFTDLICQQVADLESI